MKEFEESATGGAASVRRVGAVLAVVVVAAVIVFSLGVMVGKRVTGGGQALSEPPASLPTENLRPRPPEKKAGKSESAPSPAAKPAAGGGEAGTAEKLTFFDTLSGDKPAPPPALPKEKEPAVRKAVVEKKAEPAKPPPPKKPEPEPKPKPKPKKAEKSPGERVMAMTGSGQHYVQVASTTNRGWADDLVKRLAKKGLEAESTTVMLKGKSWYRVRIGSFPDQATAQKALGILKGIGQDGMVVRGD